MTIADQFLLALTAWRENRGAGVPGMQSVINVVMNRSARDSSSAYSECVKRLQFSSITAPGDPELTLWPSESDPQWLSSLQLVQDAAMGNLPDLTSGATLYYAPYSIPPGKTITVSSGAYPFPMSWNEAAVQFTANIGRQLFFREI